MERSLRRFLVVIALTLLTAGIVSKVAMLSPLENRKIFDFPLSIGDWTGRDIKMESHVFDSLGTPYAFLRDYTSARHDVPVNLSVVWFDDKVVSFHAPEQCLGGVGNTVREKGTTKVRLDKEYEIGRLLVELNGSKQVVLYFYFIDGLPTLSQSAIRLNILADRLKLRRTSASFIRLMAPVSTSEEETTDMLKSFLKEIYPILPAYITLM